MRDGWELPGRPIPERRLRGGGELGRSGEGQIPAEWEGAVTLLPSLHCAFLPRRVQPARVHRLVQLRRLGHAEDRA